MKNGVACFLLLVSFLGSCKNNRQKNEPEKKDEKKNFFQVNDYIKREIHYVDSLPIGITKYSTQNSKTDTAYIQSKEFDQIAQEFISNELRPEIFEKEFSETSFIDETTQTATFTYSTQNNKLQVKRVDVLATAGEGINKISSIYLEKTVRNNDTLIVKKMLWRTKTSCQIVTITELQNHPDEIKQLNLVWGTE